MTDFHAYVIHLKNLTVVPSTSSPPPNNVWISFFFLPGPPRIADKVIHRQSVRLGRTIKLLCPVEGDPPPLTMWTKDGRTIHSGWMRFRVLQQGLKIKEVESEDAGTYICKATNGFGSMNVNYTLIVIGESRESSVQPAPCRARLACDISSLWIIYQPLVKLVCPKVCGGGGGGVAHPPTAVGWSR